MSKSQFSYPKQSVCFTTKRLAIREFSQNDLEALLAYETQPGMLRFENGIADRDSAQNYLNNAFQCTTETPRTNYFLGITIPPDDAIIGRVSLTSQNSSINEWEIGWAIRMEDWGKTYAPEAARKILEFAFKGLRAHRVVAFCHTGNTNQRE